MVDDLSDLYAELRRLRRDVDRLQTATPLQNASIGSGGLRVYGGGVITIQNGGLSVTGFAQISGELRGNGTINWTGPVNFSGPVQITGTLDVTASTRLRGETTIEATARLMSELIVQGKITAGDVRIENGKVYAGGMTLDPNVAGGALTFPNGSRLEADGANNGERLIAGDAVVNVGAVASIRKGASAVSVASNNVTINASGGDVELIGGVRISGLPSFGGTGLPAGTLRTTVSGRLERADGS